MPSKYYLRHFVPNYFYHIYNRGSRKQNIFLDAEDYKVFGGIISYYMKFPSGKPLSRIAREANNTPSGQVRNLPRSSFSIVAYALLPNHFHFLLKQINMASEENSITNFMRRLSITYSMYYKKKYEHSGNIFEGKYKNILVDNDSQLIYLTKYIHRNPLKTLSSGQKLSDYPYSSYPHYLDKTNIEWLNTKDVIHFFSEAKTGLTSKAFVEDRSEFPETLKHLILE